MIPAARTALIILTLCCLAACSASAPPPADADRPGEPQETARRVRDVTN